MQNQKKDTNNENNDQLKSTKYDWKVNLDFEIAQGYCNNIKFRIIQTEY